MSVPSISATVAGVFGVAGLSYYLSKKKREMPSKEGKTTEVADISKINSDTEILDSEVDSSNILHSDSTPSGHILFVFNLINISHSKSLCFKGLAESIAQNCSEKKDTVSNMYCNECHSA